MNDALLAKQLWRLKMNPSTIVSRILKAKYFGNRDILNSQLKSSSSLAWKCIWNAGQRIITWIGMDNDQSPIWLGNASNIFSVKSAYLKLKEEQDAGISVSRGECSDNSRVQAFWKKLWHIKIESNVKIFVWRLFHNFLPVADNLRGEGVVK